MLKITKHTDLGIVLMTYFAARPEAQLSASGLASETGVSLPTVSKILKSLARGGLLDSQRGIHGGYRLARPPAEISVAEMIETLEGPIAFTECSERDGCDMEGWCPVQSNWQRINQAIRKALAAMDLQEMASPGTRAFSLLTERRSGDTTV